MDVQDMLTDINAHGFDDVDDDEKMVLINDTLWDIDAREPWPYLIKSLALNFDGTLPYPSNLPTDLKAVLWIADLTTGEAVWPERLETVRDRYANTISQVDVPLCFYFVGTQLRFYPVPATATGRFLLDYYAIQAKLTSTSVETDILMPVRHQRAIVLGALSKLAALDDDPDTAQQKLSEFEMRIQNMREDLFRQQYMRPDVIFVTDEYDDQWTYPF